MRFLRNSSMAAKTQAAFTLVEIVIALGLLSLLIGMLFMVLSASQDTVNDANHAANIHENTRIALQFMRDELLRSKPPRSDRDPDTPGQMFIIENNATGQGDDELWFTTGAGLDVLGRPVRRNVRYYVEMDPNVHLKVLKRQEFDNLLANPSQAPQTTEENSATVCEYVDHFDVQYLSFKERENKGFPEKFLPDTGDDIAKEFNFRRPDRIWDNSGLPDNQTSPPAIRVTLVVREKLSRQTYFFQRVFLVPMNTYDPNTAEAPPPTQ
jgi:type II secretory pathway pseudopilin PulG